MDVIHEIKKKVGAEPSWPEEEGAGDSGVGSVTHTRAQGRSSKTSDMGVRATCVEKMPSQGREKGKNWTNRNPVKKNEEEIHKQQPRRAQGLETGGGGS